MPEEKPVSLAPLTLDQALEAIIKVRLDPATERKAAAQKAKSKKKAPPPK
ncbi:hypothetical protein [Sphingomonas sp. URHD0057]|nr:hypothetical protein [Sphingomonas sp. URHD0057]